MAKAKNFAYTTLAEEASLRLQIDGVGDYEVSSTTGSFAVNQIPECVCMLAVGRNAFDGRQLAKIHSTARSLKQMVKAKVFFHPKGEFKVDGTKWPDGEQVIFDGYFTGLSYQKADGKVQVCVNLIHWLVDLACSSSLSSISHASNPGNLTFPAVVEPIVPGAGGNGEAVMLGSMSGMPAVTALIQSDLWEAIKTLLCGMCAIEGFNPICGTGGIGVDQLKLNDRAKKALSRIEGPTTGTGCGLAYKYGNALPLNLGIDPQAEGGIAQAICNIPITNLWNMNMWDVMVSGYCQEFGLVVCPGVDRAIIAADCPGFRGNVWRDITPNEYEFVDQSMMLPRPLRAVVSHGSTFFEAGANMDAAARGVATCVSGVFASKSVEDADGVVMYTMVPKWIAGITTSGVNAGTITGAKNNKPINTATTTGAGAKGPDKAPNEMRDDAQSVLDRYAQMVFIREQLRGRGGTISGKLRFDIAPGSKVRLNGSPEQFLGGEDELADDLWCEVNRVTFEINCEGRRAATALVMSHVRNAEENKQDRTSTSAHPFFGTAVMLGFPLLKEHDIGGGGISTGQAVAGVAV